MSWLSGEWSRLHRVTDRGEGLWSRSCEDSPGLYRLVALDNAHGLATATLQRVCGHDAGGTIYIGSAASLTGRVSDLIKQHDRARYLSRNHKPLPSKLADVFPPDCLAVCWTYLSEDVDRYAKERELITAYTDTFGEPPPLNAMP